MALVANAILVVLSLILGIRLIRQYQRRPRSHTGWYAVGLLLTAVAAFPELYNQFTGTLPTVLWWVYWSTGSTLVGFMAVGTAYLISPRVGQVALAVVGILGVWVIAATILTAGPTPELFSHESMAKAPNATIKLPFLIQNILGSLVILGGTLFSFVRTRAIYNVWIALGTLVFASGGAAAGLVDFPGAFYFTQSVGMILLYVGVTGAGAYRPSVTATG
jgi:hypothetical protein